MSAETLVAREGQYSREDVIRRLRTIADALERGTIFLLDRDVRVPDTVTLELELQEEPDDDGSVSYELEIEIEWTAPAAAEQTDEE